MTDTYIRNVFPVPGSLSSKVIIQTVSAGDNTVNHDLDADIISFTVQEGNDFVEASGNIIDSDNFNVNLAGGSITNAKITFTYEN